MRATKQEALKKAKEAAGLSAAAIAALEAAGGGISVEALLAAAEQVWPVKVMGCLPPSSTSSLLECLFNAD